MNDKTGREALRQSVTERLVTGARMDEIAATRLVTDLIDAWRSFAPRTTYDPVTGKYPPREDVTTRVATPSPDPAPLLDLGSQIAMSGGLPKELKARIDAIEGRASVEPTPPLNVEALRRVCRVLNMREPDEWAARIATEYAAILAAKASS